MSMIWLYTAGKEAERRQLLHRLERFPDEKEMTATELAGLLEISQDVASELCRIARPSRRRRRGDGLATVGEIKKVVSTSRFP